MEGDRSDRKESKDEWEGQLMINLAKESVENHKQTPRNMVSWTQVKCLNSPSTGILKLQILTIYLVGLVEGKQAQKEYWRRNVACFPNNEIPDNDNWFIYMLDYVDDGDYNIYIRNCCQVSFRNPHGFITSMTKCSDIQLIKSAVSYENYALVKQVIIKNIDEFSHLSMHNHVWEVFFQWSQLIINYLDSVYSVGE